MGDMELDPDVKRLLASVHARGWELTIAQAVELVADCRARCERERVGNTIKIKLPARPCSA